jgi:hypothetical protein
MRMLWDRHPFIYTAKVSWPQKEEPQIDWIWGVEQIEHWLYDHVGQRHSHWAWHYNDPQKYNELAVGFKYEPHRLMFVLAWSK